MYTATQTTKMKTVAQEVVRHCLSKGIHVTEECAEFVVKLLLSDPSSDFSSGVPINKDDLQHLMKLCVRKLTSEKDSLSLLTIKMQVYFNTNYASREELVQQREALRHKINKVEVTDSHHMVGQLRKQRRARSLMHQELALALQRYE